MDLYVPINPLPVCCLQQFEDHPLCPSFRAHSHSLPAVVLPLYLTHPFAYHSLHEPPPADLILVSSHPLEWFSQSIAYLPHPTPTPAVCVLRYAVKEVRNPGSKMTDGSKRPIRLPTRIRDRWGWCGEYARPKNLGKIVLLLEATSYHSANTRVLAEW
jgi:hypothetical protein